MINITVRFGGKKGKSVWNLEESSNLLAVRTRTRQPLDRVRFRSLPHNELLDYHCLLETGAAGVEVRDVANLKTRNSLRKSLIDEPDIQFAGRVLKSSDSGVPVLYTENMFLKFTDKSSENACRSVIEKHGLVIDRALGFAQNAYFCKAPDGIGLKVFELQEELFRENEIELCHPELITRKSTKAANPHQWHLKRAFIGGQSIDQHASVEAAWQLSVGIGITIAVIDDGFDLGHQEFASPGKIVAPKDVTRDSDDPRPGLGDNHGTACAGVACANGSGTPGASGVAPAAKLMPIRSASNLGSIDEAEAFYHAADNGADVISCSWGPVDGKWWDPTDPLHNSVVPLPDSTRLALDYCIENGRGGKGCVILWAAGNGNESVNNDGYASYDKVIAVAACNDRGRKSDYSDFGNSIWCAFPSSQGDGGLTAGIWTVDRRGAAGYNQGIAQLGDPAGNYTNDFGGTSSACPGAAGVAALILSVNPDLTWSQVRQILADTADKIDAAEGAYDASGHSKLYGYGRTNAERAVKEAISLGGSANPAQPKAVAAKCALVKRHDGNLGSLSLISQMLALQHKQADNFQELLRMVGGTQGLLRSRRAPRDGPDGGGTCSLNSKDDLGRVVIRAIENETGTAGVTRDTSFADDLGLDSESTAALFIPVRDAINDAGCVIHNFTSVNFASNDTVGDAIDALEGAIPCLA